MLELLPFLLICTVGLLVLVLAARIKGLYTNFNSQDECFATAVKFAHRQLGKLGTDLTKVNDSVCLYLIGAIEFIGKQNNYSVQERRILTIKVLKTFFDISAKDLSTYYSNAAKREPNSDQDNMIRSGAKAARLWQVDQKTSAEFDLNNQLNAGMLAAA